MKIENAASAFEAYFLRTLLKEAKLGESAIGGGRSGQSATFSDMLVEALADQIAGAQPLGLSTILPTQNTLDVMPVAGRVTSAFGPRRDPIHGEHRHHDGIDVAAPEGTPVVAAKAGVVTRAEDAGAYGLVLVIDHGEGLETRYAHLKDFAVRPGQRVEAGAKVGTVGMSGRTTGPHLHFEVRNSGQALDPGKVISPLKGR